jgi:hypothetical protein
MAEMKLGNAFLLLSLANTTAFADDAPSEISTDPVTDAAPAAAATPRYPTEVINRPLTLPAGLALAGADVIAFNSITVDATTMMSSSELGVAGALAAGYGVTDELEINTIAPTYAFALKEFEAKGALDVGVGFKLLRGALDGKLEVIARAVAGYDFKGEAARPIRIGIHAQYNATPKLCIVSHDLGLGNAGVSIAVDGDPKPVFATLPIGVGFQASSALYAEVNTAVLPILEISKTETQTIADVTPATLTLVYNTLEGHLDLLGYAGFGDLQEAGDTYSFGAGARYYLGAVE